MRKQEVFVMDPSDVGEDGPFHCPECKDHIAGYRYSDRSTIDRFSGGQ